MATRTRPRKWIDRELAGLDPTVDYDRIVKLNTAYRNNMFQLSFFFAYLFPHFQMTARQAKTVYREGRGGLISSPADRLDTQNRNMLTWWQFGPRHPVTIRSIERLNAIHAAVAKSFPGAFAVQGDYIYALGILMAAPHVMMRRLGEEGYPEQMKLASYRFWSEMVPLFTSEGGKGLEGWPKDFDGVLAMMEEYESRPWAFHPEGRATCEAAIRQFAELNFPTRLHGLARAIVLTMYPDHIIRTFKLNRPNPILQKAIRQFFRTMGFLSTSVLADPEDTIWERLYRSKAADGTMFAPVRDAEAA